MLAAAAAAHRPSSSTGPTSRNDPADFLFKFLIIGNAATGKSSIMHNLLGHKFVENKCHTVGIEVGSKVINVAQKSCKLQIYDTAGQERFRSITKSYYRGAIGALLVYDITSRDSFNALSHWLADARSLANSDIVILLVGNKKDLDQEREVTFVEASQFAQENELIFLETSAKTGENVEEAFLKCSKVIIEKIESNVIDCEKIGSSIQYGGRQLSQSQSNRRIFSDCMCQDILEIDDIVDLNEDKFNLNLIPTKHDAMKYIKTLKRYFSSTDEI